MILIACVDDNLGMAFNRRRQSQDRVLRERMLERVGGAPLWMRPYSARQFGPLPPNVRPAEDFLERAGAGEYAFTELDAPGRWVRKIEGILLYRWGRSYPADLTFDLSLEGFAFQSSLDFAGSSHPEITEEIYIR